MRGKIITTLVLIAELSIHREVRYTLKVSELFNLGDLCQTPF